MITSWHTRCTYMCSSLCAQFAEPCQKILFLSFRCKSNRMTFYLICHFILNYINFWWWVMSHAKKSPWKILESYLKYFWIYIFRKDVLCVFWKVSIWSRVNDCALNIYFQWTNIWCHIKSRSILPCQSILHQFTATKQAEEVILFHKSKSSCSLFQ